MTGLADDDVPRLETPLEHVHALVRDAFHREAALARGYAYWVPVTSSLEDKLIAAHLVYLHTRNADELYRLMDFLRLPRPDTGFAERFTREITARMQTFGSFVEMRRALDGAVLTDVAFMRELVGSSAELFDYYVAEALEGVLRRYDERIAPSVRGAVDPVTKTKAPAAPPR